MRTATLAIRSSIQMGCWLLLVFWVSQFRGSTIAAELPSGFVAETIATSLNCATAIVPAPDGRVFIAEQTGRLLVWKNGRVLETPALTLHVTDYWERGLIGLALHPDFPRAPHIYALYVTDKPFVHHVLSRFTFQQAGGTLTDIIDPASERILLEGDDQAKLGGSQPGGHQGGPLCFGGDGKLYVALGEQTAGEPSQKLTTLQGKVLRLNPDGTIPDDNPFLQQTTGKYRTIFALGVRNPFGLAAQPETSRMFFTDVGNSAFEEVNELEPGANYGWPRHEGYSTNKSFKSPLYAYPPVIGRSIVGGTFVPRSDSLGWPEKWRGKFLFGDFMNHWIKALDPDASTNVITFARGFNGPVALTFAPDNSLLVLNRGTIWRDPKRVAANSGSLMRIRYSSDSAGSAVAGASLAPPPRLSLTGLFNSLAILTPKAEFIPIELNAPVWQPGVTAQRWLLIPPGAKVQFSITNDWILPPGTIVLQHFALSTKPPSRTTDPWETHIIWIGTNRCARAGAYRWREDGMDAVLVEDGEIVNLPGLANRHWFSPGAEECLTLDTVVNGFLLQLNTAQLNRGNQLRDLNGRGFFEPTIRDDAFASLPRLAALGNTSVSVEHRVRSYLDANCCVCHRPGGFARGNFDARFTTPLAQQNLINGALIAGDLGIPGSRVVVPGDPGRSILLQRLKRTDFFRMPPVSMNDESPPVLPLVQQWIESLGKPAATR